MSELSAHAALVYFGCYTTGAGGDGAGISVASREPDTGALTEPRLAVSTVAPSFLARHPSLPLLYAVNEVADGGLSAFAIGEDGGLTPVGEWSTGGAYPCHLAVGDAHVYVANYGSGSVAVFPFGPDGIPTGRADLAVHSGSGPDEKRQEGPHAHMVVPDGDGVLAVDLGADAVLRHPLDPATGGFGPPTVLARTPPGFGPRQLVRGPGLVHLVGELDPGVVTYDVRDDGWHQIGRVACTEEPSAQPSAIATSADGRFLFVGNRGPDTVGVLSLVDAVPTWVGEVSCGGAWPRHFITVGEYLYVANERSHQIAVLRVDTATGLLASAGDPVSTPSPTCVLPLG